MRSQAEVERENAFQKRRASEAKLTEANMKRRSRDTQRAKSQKALNHADDLKRERQEVLRRINNYQREIDNCRMLMRENEKDIDMLKVLIMSLHTVIQECRAEAKRLKDESDALKREADSNVMPGQHLQQIGNNVKAKELLERAEAKQREAIAKDRDADNEERLAADRQRTIQRLCDKLLLRGRQREQNERVKEQEERRFSLIYFIHKGSNKSQIVFSGLLR